MVQSGAHLLYKVGHNKICAPVGHKVGHKSGAQQNMCPIGAQCGAQKLGTFVLRFGFKVEQTGVIRGVVLQWFNDGVESVLHLLLLV